MALSRTNHIGSIASEGSPGTAAYTSASFTPANNSLLVVGAFFMQELASTDYSGDITISDTAGLTWTARVTRVRTEVYSQIVRIWTAPVTTGASMTVSIDAGAIDLWVAGLSIVAYTGYDTDTPTGGIGTFVQNSPAGAGESLTLDAAPASADEVFAIVGMDKENLGVTAGTGWTELYDLQAGGSGGFQVQIRTGSTSTTVAWDDIHTGGGGISGAEGAAVVIKADTGVSGTAAATFGGSFTASGEVDPSPTVVANGGAALTASDDPSVTFSGYTPLEDDVVVLFVSSTAVLAIQVDASLPSGWVNPLGSGVEINSDAHGMCVAYHLVTAAEESGGTTTYTATNLLTATATGYVQGVVVRFADPSGPIDGFNTAQGSGNTTTPHVLAGITGAGVLEDRSLVVSSVAKDATGAYSSVPGGWSQIRADNTNNGRWLGRRDALTTADTDVSATNITPSAGDEYASITLAFAHAGVATVTGVAAATFSFSGTAAGVPKTFGTAAATFGFTGTAAGVPDVQGVAAAAFTFTGTALGQPFLSGQAVADFGGSFTASGVVGEAPVEGQAVAAFGGSFTASGTPEVFGVAVASFGFTETAAGIDRALGAAVASFGGSFTASGAVEVFGAAVASFGGSFTGSGFAGTPPVTGTAAATFGGTFTSSGTPNVLGVAAASFSYTATAAGTPETFGVAASSFGFLGAAAGVPDVQGAAVAAFTFLATVNIISYRLRLVSAAEPRYTATATGRRYRATAGTNRYTSED